MSVTNYYALKRLVSHYKLLMQQTICKQELNNTDLSQLRFTKIFQHRIVEKKISKITEKLKKLCKSNSERKLKIKLN